MTVRCLIWYLPPLVLLLAMALPSSAQTLFFDQLPTTDWVVQASENEALRQASTLHLQAAKDTSGTKLPATVSWLFGKRLLVRHYDAASKQMVTIASYTYQIDRTHAILSIFLDEKTPISYRVGITSTGKSVVLFRTCN